MFCAKTVELIPSGLESTSVARYIAILDVLILFGIHTPNAMTATVEVRRNSWATTPMKTAVAAAGSSCRPRARPSRTLCQDRARRRKASLKLGTERETL